MPYGGRQEKSSEIKPPHRMKIGESLAKIFFEHFFVHIVRENYFFALLIVDWGPGVTCDALKGSDRISRLE